ncbi:hypothetical protein EW146_g4755 [Bondarzewia mesenterica]|uniref:Protein FRA10AC1 n=1 Tax=Bondarzewia mesenterica TaxID=1095465 RepID=A0A4S4LVF3_9AGAM|nr:hypothetical protein EW146_g4755 [Bondarzewia mesenterica]
MALYRNKPHASGSTTSYSTEFDILKASHKFLREDDDENPGQSSWNDQLAQKYYSSLFREFAVCDLKHYKSGNFALRWRTEAEVLSSTGETTCGNTRCSHHVHPDHDPDAPPAIPLKTLELPFAYEEQGQIKSALVKVVLCDKCCKKLMWKRNKEKDEAMRTSADLTTQMDQEPKDEAERVIDLGPGGPSDEKSRHSEPRRSRTRGEERRERGDEGGMNEENSYARRHQRHSRSRSPRQNLDDRHSTRRRSPSPRPP